MNSAVETTYCNIVCKLSETGWSFNKRILSIANDVLNYHSKIPKGFSENNWVLLAKEPPKKGVYIKDIFFSQIQEPDKSKNRFIFGIRFPYGSLVKYKSRKKTKASSKSKCWFFYCDTQSELNKWLFHLQKIKEKYVQKPEEYKIVHHQVFRLGQPFEEVSRVVHVEEHAPMPVLHQATIENVQLQAHPPAKEQKEEEEVDISEEIAYLLFNYARLLNEKKKREEAPQ